MPLFRVALETAALDVRVTWPGESVFRNRESALQALLSSQLTVSLAASPSKLPQAPIAVRRLLFGVGQERGRIGVELINNEEVEHEIVWSEVWPWWLRAFVSTLETQTDGQSAPGKSDRFASIPLFADPRSHRTHSRPRLHPCNCPRTADNAASAHSPAAQVGDPPHPRL